MAGNELDELEKRVECVARMCGLGLRKKNGQIDPKYRTSGNKYAGEGGRSVAGGVNLPPRD